MRGDGGPESARHGHARPWPRVTYGVARRQGHPEYKQEEGGVHADGGLTERQQLQSLEHGVTGGDEFRQGSPSGSEENEEEHDVLGKLQLDSFVRKEEDSESVTTARSTELEEVTDGGGRDGGVRGVRGVLSVLRHQGSPARAPRTGRERETRRTRGTPPASSARSRTSAIRGGSGGQQPASRVMVRLLGAQKGECGREMVGMGSRGARGCRDGPWPRHGGGTTRGVCRQHGASSLPGATVKEGGKRGTNKYGPVSGV